jgi:uncharacterized protein
MKEIIRGEEWVLPFYDNNENDNIEYKLSDYAFVEKCDDGYLLLHTITWSLFLLNEFEYENILKYDYFKKWFIVLDKNINEEEIAVKVYLERGETKNFFESLSHFIISPTTFCNAQCAYCFQQNASKKHMSIETSNNIANFIIKNGREPINLEWFGGEPLLNISVINNICEKLSDANKNFKSTIITNSLLFNNEILEKCKNTWNVYDIQITIDEYGEKYNAIKNYKNSNIDAFNEIINNIKTILEKSNIIVKIRLNVSDENILSIENVVNFLYENFNMYIMNGRLYIYLATLYDIAREKHEIFTEILLKLEELNTKFPFLDNYFNTPQILNHKPLFTCMADRGDGVTITPKGNFIPCTVWDENESEIIGDIYSGVTNYDKVNEWVKKGKTNIEFCRQKKCKYLPMCNHLNKCKGYNICINDNHRNYFLSKLKKSILLTYNEYKKRIN